MKVKKENIIPGVLILSGLVLVAMYGVGFFDPYWGRLNSISWVRFLEACFGFCSICKTTGQ